MYPSTANKFIKITTRSCLPWEKDIQIIPNSRLVYFLSKLGRTEEAKNIINNLSLSFKEDTENFKLKELNWDWDSEIDEASILYHVLVSRLRLPISAVKWWTAQQLSDLLAADDTKDLIEKHLLEDLATRRLESECVEILSVFWMATRKGYAPSAEISGKISARSILSDMLIKDIMPTPIGYGKEATNIQLLFQKPKDDKGFGKVNGKEIPSIFELILKHIEKIERIPFTEYYKFEWVRTFEYSPSGNSIISYFVHSDREATGGFNTDNSHRGRSAYLRTLQHCMQEKVPESIIKDYALWALPFDPLLANLSPSNPEWLADWKASIQITQENLLAFLQQCTKNINFIDKSLFLGALSFPIIFNSFSRVDITCLCGFFTAQEASPLLFERVGGYSSATRFEDRLHYQTTVREQFLATNCRPLVSQVEPKNRFGHWHSDIETRGIYVPVLSTIESELIGTCEGHHINFNHDGNTIGHCGYWNVNWDVAYPQGFGPNCGTYTLLNKDHLKTWVTEPTLSSLSFLCRARFTTKKMAYESYSTEEMLFTFPCELTT
ncbi:hypothetical protein [Desulfovibrio sp. JC010]|uniref:hypothetical protein n=1 Tax=Desulfovibrio sp. JC010 TaxID=2593641 RepID=UPI0013D2450C|nr:hypothetical protein [Desulfovibrio sp. JC010]NDV25960.1 hypothetical protein [Desulfovibrio sp. JC010]